MVLRLDPRSTMPSSATHSSSFICHRSGLVSSNSRQTVSRFSSFSLGSKPRIKPCNDWILSSATNVHVALDRCAFKEYIPFDSYVLALSDNRQVHVEGIGTVELKIRRKPDSRDSHVILLTDVLHIPSWLCNIFSGVYFDSSHMYEHTWSTTGVQFRQREGGGSRSWGYTEGFCSLDRIVLARHPKDSRSPMLEDKDREIFSVNLIWPHSQRDQWQEYRTECQKCQPFPICSEPGSATIEGLIKNSPKSHDQTTYTAIMSRRANVNDTTVNVVQAPVSQIDSPVGSIGAQEKNNAAA